MSVWAAPGALITRFCGHILLRENGVQNSWHRKARLLPLTPAYCSASQEVTVYGLSR